MSYSKTAKIGVVWGFLSRGMTELVSIPTSVILARLLTPFDFGVGAAAGFFIQIAQRLTNFGFNTALIQTRDLRPDHTATVFVANLLLGLAVWAALSVSSPALGAMFHSADAARVIPIAALTFVIGSFGSVSQSLIVRELRFKSSAIIDWVYIWVLSASALIMAWLGYGYWSLVWSQVLATFVQNATRLVVAGWVPRFRFSRAALNELLSFALGLHFKRLMDAAAQNIDNLVVGRMLGMMSLGLYDKAFTTMTRAVVAVSSAGPSVSFRIFVLIQDDYQRFRLGYRKVLLTSTFIAYPLLAWLIAVAPDLFLLMFGQQWVSAVTPFRILCLAAPLKILNTYASTATQSKGWVWGEVWRQGIYVALIVAGVGIGTRWGLTGAAWGLMAATVLMTLMMHSFLQRVSGLSWTDMFAPQVPALACSAALLIALLIAAAVGARLMPWYASASFRLVAASAIGGAVCVAFARFAPVPDLRMVIDETVLEFAPRLAWLLAPGATLPGTDARVKRKDAVRASLGK